MAIGDIDFGGSTIVAKAFKSGNTAPGGGVSNTTAAGSTLTLNAATHAGRTILLDTASGSVVTFPAATGTGNTYEFLVSTTATSNSHIVKVGNTTDTMVGFSISISAAGSIVADAASGTDDTVTMNGTTTGGAVGTYIRCTDYAAGKWAVQVFAAGSGVAAAAAFSATV
jgi:hypothetical protein